MRTSKSPRLRKTLIATSLMTVIGLGMTSMASAEVLPTVAVHSNHHLLRTTSNLLGAPTVLAEPSEAAPACWAESESYISLCASDEPALAEAVFHKFGVVFTNAGTPTTLTRASQTAQNLTARTEIASATQPTTRSTYILGKVFASTDFGGYTWTDTTSRANPCGTAGNHDDALFNWWPLQIMNDNVESVAPLSPCKITLWSGNNKTDSSTGKIGTTANLYAMRDEASSWQYSR